MENKKTKTVKQKMIVVPILIVMLFNVIFPNYSHADVGGVLASPLVGLLALITDVGNLLIETLVGEETDGKVYITKDEARAEYVSEHESTEETADYEFDVDEMVGDYGIPSIDVTPAEIFSNSIPLLNANFFTDFDSGDFDSNGNYTGKSIIGHLKGTIAEWYQTLRLIALAGLLSVLVYIGIRIMLSSTAADKAKYKERAKDWIVAMCLVFMLHYIMVLIMTSVDAVTATLGGIDEDGKSQNLTVAVYDGDDLDKVDGQQMKFYTNLMGYMRLSVEYSDFFPKFSALVLYMALTFYTIYFMIRYLKRLLTLVFLTLIAPLVALTYPLDKLKDGKAQAFNYWLREYSMNALLPIIHLILYTVLVGTAGDLVKQSPIYAIVAVAFISPAEKLVKKMFGFDSETSSAGSFAGGAMAASALSSMAKRHHAPPRKEDSGNENGATKIKSYADKGKLKSDVSDLAIGAGGNANEPQGRAPQGRVANGGGSYAPQIQLANHDAGQDEMHSWGAESTGFSPEIQMANLDAGFDEMHGWGTEPIGYSQEQQMANLNAGLDEMFAGDMAQGPILDRASMFNINPGEIGQATDNAARELRSNGRVRKIANNAKQMAVNRWRNTGGARGLAGRAGRRAAGAAGTIARAAVKAPAIMAGATIGLAAGMVGGDMNDIWKGMAGGAVAGNVLANNMTSRRANRGSSIRNTGNELLYGEAEAHRRAREREFINNKDNINYVNEKYQDMTAKERRDVLKKMAVYSDAGSAKAADKMQKLEERYTKEAKENNPELLEKQEDGFNLIQKQVHATWDQFKNVSDDYFIDPTKREKLSEGTVERVMASNPNMSKDEARRHVDRRIEDAAYLKGF